MLQPSIVFSALFAALVLSVLLTRFWLASRQIRHVAAHRDHVPADFAAVVDLQAHRKAAAYTVDKVRWGLLESAWSAACTLAWTLLGGLDALNQGMSDGVGAGLPGQLALLAAFVAISALLGLPFSWWETFRLEARHGFNRNTLGGWLIDGLKSALVAAALGLPLAALVLWVMAHAGTWWWLWAWVAFMAFNLLMLVVIPTWIAPLFNRFTPLADDALRQRVQALMTRCGFEAQDCLVMDGSRRSAHANAYFTGLGRTKRVVFFDTLLTLLSPGEVEAVLAHELGHYHHRHIPRRLAQMAGLSLGALALLGWLSGQSWFYTGLGVQPSLAGSNSAVALLLFGFLAPQLGFFLSPWLALGSRRHEFQADAYACQQAQAADLRSALLKLYRDNASTLTPDPVYVRFFHSHPPAGERLARLVSRP